jgi:hypothetical protein
VQLEQLRDERLFLRLRLGSALHFVDHSPDLFDGVLSHLARRAHHSVARLAHELVLARGRWHHARQHTPKSDRDGTHQEWVLFELVLQKTLRSRGLRLDLLGNLAARFLDLIYHVFCRALDLTGYLGGGLLGLVGGSADGLLTGFHWTAAAGALRRRGRKSATAVDACAISWRRISGRSGG